MGQATSSPNALSFFQKISNSDKSEYKDISNKFSKATLSTLTVPVIVIAYPALNAYAFHDMGITGHRVVDVAIGGLLGVIACKHIYIYIYIYSLSTFKLKIKSIGPLSPFLAIWGAVQINFKDKPPVPLPISPEILLKAQQEIKLNTISFYNVAIVGVSGNGKVREDPFG